MDTFVHIPLVSRDTTQPLLKKFCCWFSIWIFLSSLPHLSHMEPSSVLRNDEESRKKREKERGFNLVMEHRHRDRVARHVLAVCVLELGNLSPHPFSSSSSNSSSRSTRTGLSSRIRGSVWFSFSDGSIKVFDGIRGSRIAEVKEGAFYRKHVLIEIGNRAKEKSLSICSVDINGIIKIWRPKMIERPVQLGNVKNRHRGIVSSALWLSSSATLWLSDSRGDISVWQVRKLSSDTPTLKMVKSFSVTGPVFCLCSVPKTESVWIGGTGKVFRVSIKDFQIETQEIEGEKQVGAIRYLQKKNRVVICFSGYRLIQIWCGSTFCPLTSLNLPRDSDFSLLDSETGVETGYSEPFLQKEKESEPKYFEKNLSIEIEGTGSGISGGGLSVGGGKKLARKLSSRFDKDREKEKRAKRRSSLAEDDSTPRLSRTDSEKRSLQDRGSFLDDGKKSLSGDLKTPREEGTVNTAADLQERDSKRRSRLGTPSPLSTPTLSVNSESFLSPKNPQLKSDPSPRPVSPSSLCPTCTLPFFPSSSETDQSSPEEICQCKTTSPIPIRKKAAKDTPQKSLCPPSTLSLTPSDPTPPSQNQPQIIVSKRTALSRTSIQGTSKKKLKRHHPSGEDLECLSKACICDVSPDEDLVIVGCMDGSASVFCAQTGLFVQMIPYSSIPSPSPCSSPFSVPSHSVPNQTSNSSSLSASTFPSSPAISSIPPSPSFANSPSFSSPPHVNPPSSSPSFSPQTLPPSSPSGGSLSLPSITPSPPAHANVNSNQQLQPQTETQKNNKPTPAPIFSFAFVQPPQKHWGFLLWIVDWHGQFKICVPPGFCIASCLSAKESSDAWSQFSRARMSGLNIEERIDRAMKEKKARSLRRSATSKSGSVVGSSQAVPPLAINAQSPMVNLTPAGKRNSRASPRRPQPALLPEKPKQEVSKGWSMTTSPSELVFLCPDHDTRTYSGPLSAGRYRLSLQLTDTGPGSGHIWAEFSVTCQEAGDLMNWKKKMWWGVGGDRITIQFQIFSFKMTTWCLTFFGNGQTLSPSLSINLVPLGKMNPPPQLPKPLAEPGTQSYPSSKLLDPTPLSWYAYSSSRENAKKVVSESGPEGYPIAFLYVPSTERIWISFSEGKVGVYSVTPSFEMLRMMSCGPSSPRSSVLMLCPGMCVTTDYDNGRVMCTEKPYLGVVSVLEDGRMVVWSDDESRKLTKTTGMKGLVKVGAVVPAMHRLCIGDTQGTVAVWSYSKENYDIICLAQFCFNEPLRSMVSTDSAVWVGGRSGLTILKGKVYCVSILDPQIVCTFHSLESGVTDIMTVPYGVWTFSNNHIHIWCGDTYKLIGTLRCKKSMVLSSGTDYNGRVSAIGFLDNYVQLIDPWSLEHLQRSEVEHTDSVRCLVFGFPELTEGSFKFVVWTSSRDGVVFQRAFSSTHAPGTIKQMIEDEPQTSLTKKPSKMSLSKRKSLRFLRESDKEKAEEIVPPVPEPPKEKEKLRNWAKLRSGVAGGVASSMGIVNPNLIIFNKAVHSLDVPLVDVLGSPLEKILSELQTTMGPKRGYGVIPDLVVSLCDGILLHPHECQELFRTAGQPAEMEIVFLQFQKDRYDLIDLTKLSVHSSANVLKKFFSELPGHLLSLSVYTEMINYYEKEGEIKEWDEVEGILSKLEPHRIPLVRYLLSFFYNLAVNKSVSTQKLSITFAPHIFESTAANPSPEIMQKCMKEMSLGPPILESLIRASSSLNFKFPSFDPSLTDTSSSAPSLILSTPLSSRPAARTPNSRPALPSCNSFSSFSTQQATYSSSPPPP